MRSASDLLAHHHRAELGGIGAARTAGDHDGDDEHADLAQDENADEVDGVHFRAELAEVEDALLRDDGADQESDEQDDRHRLPADAVELIDGGGEAEIARARDDARGGDADGAEHIGEGAEIAAEARHAPAQGGKSRDDGVGPRGRSDRLEVHPAHLFQQGPVMLGHADHRGLPADAAPLPRQPLEQPGAVGVEFAHPAHVDGNSLRLGRVLRGTIDERFEFRRMWRGPRAAGGKLKPAVFELGCQQSRVARHGHLRRYGR